MAKTIAPLLSFDASGAIAKTQVYSKWKGRPYVRRYVIPANPRTADQTEVRSTFSYLNNVWKYAPASVVESYDAYAQGQVMTGRNAIVRINLSNMYEEVDLNEFVFSPGARSGLAAIDIDAQPTDESIVVVLTPPLLPNGWSIIAAWAAGLRQGDPHTSTDYQMSSGTDETDPWQVLLSGLENGVEYHVGGWFTFMRPDGKTAYGRSIEAQATPSA